MEAAVQGSFRNTGPAWCRSARTGDRGRPSATVRTSAEATLRTSVGSPTVVSVRYPSVYRSHIVPRGYLRQFAVNGKIVAVDRDGIEESKPIEKAGTRAH